MKQPLILLQLVIVCVPVFVPMGCASQVLKPSVQLLLQFSGHRLDALIADENFL